MINLNDMLRLSSEIGQAMEYEFAKEIHESECQQDNDDGPECYDDIRGI